MDLIENAKKQVSEYLVLILNAENEAEINDYASNIMQVVNGFATNPMIVEMVEKIVLNDLNIVVANSKAKLYNKQRFDDKTINLSILIILQFFDCLRTVI